MQRSVLEVFLTAVSRQKGESKDEKSKQSVLHVFLEADPRCKGKDILRVVPFCSTGSLPDEEETLPMNCLQEEWVPSFSKHGSVEAMDLRQEEEQITIPFIHMPHSLFYTPVASAPIKEITDMNLPLSWLQPSMITSHSTDHELEYFRFIMLRQKHKNKFSYRETIFLWMETRKIVSADAIREMIKAVGVEKTAKNLTILPKELLDNFVSDKFNEDYFQSVYEKFVFEFFPEYKIAADLALEFKTVKP